MKVAASQILTLISGMCVEGLVPAATRYAGQATLSLPANKPAKEAWPSSRLTSSSSQLPAFSVLYTPVASATIMSAQPSISSGLSKSRFLCSPSANGKRRHHGSYWGRWQREHRLLGGVAKVDSDDEDDEGDGEYDNGEMEYDDGLDSGHVESTGGMYTFGCHGGKFDHAGSKITRLCDEASSNRGMLRRSRNTISQLKRSATMFRQVSWISWWAQTILSTVAFIIVLFSNAVTNRTARGNLFGNGVGLALGSLVCSAASVCWTWGYVLKAKGWRKLGSLKEVDEARVRMRKSLKVGLYVNVVGMLLALVGAEQIVGTLVAKVLYSQGFQPSLTVGNLGAAEAAQSQFRALDVFVVQANTNTLLSHFCSLAASLWLLTRLPKLAILAKGA